MAKIIKVNGTESFVTPANGKTFSLEELQGVVGGYIEIIGIGSRLMVVNEEGKLRDLPVNRKATKLAGAYIFPFDYGICGDVLIASDNEID